MSKLPGQKKTPFHDGGEAYAPQVVLEGLRDAGHEMSYSNYHNRLFGIAERVIKAYCEEHGIPLGPTKAEREETHRKAQADALKSAESGDINAVLKLLRGGT